VEFLPEYDIMEKGNVKNNRENDIRENRKSKILLAILWSDK